MARDWLERLVHEANEPYPRGTVPSRTQDVQQYAFRRRPHIDSETVQLGVSVAPNGPEPINILPTLLQPSTQLYHDLDELLEFGEWTSGHDGVP